MICNKCNKEGRFVEWEAIGVTHAYWYCSPCKEEIQPQELNSFEMGELERAFEDLLKQSDSLYSCSLHFYCSYCKLMHTPEFKGCAKKIEDEFYP